MLGLATDYAVQILYNMIWWKVDPSQEATWIIVLVSIQQHRIDLVSLPLL